MRRDSSVVAAAAVRLDLDYIRHVDWWEHATFDDGAIRHAAGLAFDVFEPGLRSRGNPTQAALDLLKIRPFVPSSKSYSEESLQVDSPTRVYPTWPGKSIASSAGLLRSRRQTVTKRLDWDKEGRDRRVREHGAERAQPGPTTRMVYASDALVAQLEDRGYGGKRPESAAEARDLLRLYKKLGVTHTMIDRAADLPAAERQKRANDLFDKLEAGLEEAVRDKNKRDRKQLQRNAAVLQDRLLRLLAPQR